MPPPPPPHPPSPPPTPPPLSAHRLPLPPSHPPPASLLLAPPSSPARALALLFPDSSAHLFPSLPSSSPTSSPAPTTVRSPLAAAACFALLLPSSHLLFLSAHPSPASPAVHLRAYSLASAPAFPRFAPAPLSFKRNASASGLPLQGLPFGLGVCLAAGVNAVALLSLAAGQIWVLAPKLAADGRTVELHKCAVIELEPARPVYAMEIAMGRMLLGEAGGLRVFPLRGLMKGGKEREGKKGSAVAAGKKFLSKKNGMVNGLVMPVRRNSYADAREGDAVSTQTQIFWVSDGGHSVHVMSAVEIESPNGDNGDVTRERELASIKLSGCDNGDVYYSQLNLITNAIEAIFTSERVQDIVPISKDSILILGQGNMFLYGTS
ncbi:hypothetical protein U9M48_018017 [Paspalum notatum var. saurae]|uniref:Uncharacterized protein n=1 Tax=Paspalum notatum var. saurae TaxID=547442 RepID=A0AAQ3WPE4_PASNO